MNRFARWGRVGVLLLGCLLLAGCQTGEIFWSPDGSAAAYFNGEGGHAWVIDEQGKPLAELGASSGGFAWSADSSALYLAAMAPAAVRPQFQFSQAWALPAPVATTQPATQPTTAQPPKELMTVAQWRSGALTPLFTLEDKQHVWYMALSPDQNWLAAVVFVEGQKDHYSLYAYSLAGRRLYQLSDLCGLGLCFTGPNRLAYVQVDGTGESPQITGQVVEVNLEDAAAQLPRTPLLVVLWESTPWLQPLGGDLLLTTQARSVPSRPMPVDDETFKLYHFSRADGGLTVLAEEVGRLFMPSPDAKRILFEKITPASATAPKKHELAVMNVNGSGTQVLRDLGEYPTLPLYPNWRTNDQIAFVPSPADKPPEMSPEGHAYVEVVLYRLADQGRLEPLRTLSADWPQTMKPRFKLEAATQPTTKP